MKGVITAKVLNVFAIDSKPTANGGVFSKREVWLVDDITDPRYPNYYTIEFQGQATSIPDIFNYMQTFSFDIEVKGRKYTKPGTQVENIFTTIRCWRATPVQIAAPHPVQQEPNPYVGQPAGFYPATPQQSQSAGQFMPNQPGTFQPGGFQPPAQQPMGQPGGFPQPAAQGFQPNAGNNQGFNQPAVNGFGSGGQGPTPMFNQPGAQNNGFNQAAGQPNMNNGFQQNNGYAPVNQPAPQPQPSTNSADVADDLPF